MTRRPVLAVLAFAILVASCSSGRDGAAAGSPGSPSPAPTRFCRRLIRLDDRLRDVRSLTDTTATVARYAAGAVALDLAFRKMQGAAPGGFDIQTLEYANGQLGQIVRALPPDIGGPAARARVALALAAYDAALYQALLKECGPGSVAPGAG